MAFRPTSPNELQERLNTTDHEISYRLAVLTCGGQGTSTDRVARIIRRELPPLLMRAAAIEAGRLARERTRKEIADG